MNARELGADIIRELCASTTRTGRLSRVVVAYSGGMDSHVLLHALAAHRSQLPAPLQAVYVDHGLQEASAAWGRHCGAVCRALGIQYHIVRIDGAPAPGESVEAWARHHRYEALAARIGEGGGLVTAHHRDDQAETFLLAAIRGAGPHGLGGMPAVRALGRGWLLRPLIGIGRDRLRLYATANDLRWITDTSNTDPGYDRNYIRASVLPQVEARWPGAAKTLARAAGLQREIADCGDEFADRILSAHAAGASAQLPLTALDGLSDAAARIVVRRWIRLAGYPAPAYRRIVEIQTNLVRAAEDTNPCVRWSGVELRRYRGSLFLLPASGIVGVDAVYAWHPGESLSLPWGRLKASPGVGHGLARGDCEPGHVTVRFRRGGERCHPSGRRHSQTLKRLYQEWGVPPWQRGLIPLIHIDGRLAAVGSICVCRPFAAGDDEPSWVLDWEWGRQPVPKR